MLILRHIQLRFYRKHLFLLCLNLILRRRNQKKGVNNFSLILGEYGWLFIVGILTLLFRSTIEKLVAGLMIFMGNDYNEDDVVEVDGKPGRIVRVGIWSTTFFTYDVRDGIIVGGAKLVIQNDKLKDIKIEKPLHLLDKRSSNEIPSIMSKGSSVLPLILLILLPSASLTNA